jgi:hypothetical protein
MPFDCSSPPFVFSATRFFFFFWAISIKGTSADLEEMRRALFFASASRPKTYHCIFQSPAAVTAAVHWGFSARGFTAPPNIGPGKESSFKGDAAGADIKPKWHWILLMCIGCVCGGAGAAQMVDVDKDSLPPMFRREEIEAQIARTFEFRPDLAPTVVRCAFVLAARRAGVTSTLLEESCAATAGLDDLAGVLNFSKQLHDISMEDLTALVAIAAVKFLGGPTSDLPLLFGRKDSDKAPPKRPLPPGAATRPVAETLKALGDLTDSECVALMACHAVGEYHEDVSGIDGAQRSMDRYRLGPHYFRTLLSAEKLLKEFEVGRTEGNRRVLSLPQKPLTADVESKKTKKKQRCVYMDGEVKALLKNPEWRKWVELFATDKAAWEKEFQVAFSKMINSNYTDNLRPYPLRTRADSTKAELTPSKGEEKAR